LNPKRLLALLLFALLIIANSVRANAFSQDELKTYLGGVYGYVSDAEASGGNIRPLAGALNQAAALINSGSNDNLTEAQHIILEVLGLTTSVSLQGKQSTLIQYFQLGAEFIVLVISAILIWRYGLGLFGIARLVGNERLENHSHSMDNLFKLVALALIIMLMSVSVYPLIYTRRSIEPSSELGILGPNGKIGDYPTEVVAGKSIHLFIYVGNIEGKVEYYQVQVKLADQASEANDTIPLKTPVLKSYELVLMNGENQTLPVTISFGQPRTNLRLVFELYNFDPKINDFVYNQLWTQLRMNVTRT